MGIRCTKITKFTSILSDIIRLRFDIYIRYHITLSGDCEMVHTHRVVTMDDLHLLRYRYRYILQAPLQGTTHRHHSQSGTFVFLYTTSLFRYTVTGRI